MFGTLRLMLALLVAHSHIHTPVVSDWLKSITIQELHNGALAVVGFYIISGFLMVAIYEKLAKRSAKPIVHFYQDRGLRIAPLYFVATIFTIVVYLVLLNKVLIFPPLAVFAHVTLLPLNLHPIWDLRLDQSIPYLLIPPVWSLALETQFYALTPLLIKIRRHVYTLLWLSLAFFGWDSLWGKYPMTFSYGLPFGTVFIFITGMAIYYAQIKRHLKAKTVVKKLWGLCFVLLALIKIFHRDTVGYSEEVLIGLLVFIPIVWLLSTKPRFRWDDNLGSLAYPIFLLHYPVSTVIRHYYPEGKPAQEWLVYMTIIVVAILAVIIVERPVQSLRHHLINIKSTKKITI